MKKTLSIQAWSVRDKMNTAEETRETFKALASYGFTFTYHHHGFEFASYGNETIMDILVKGLNPKTTSFVLDTHWLQAGGVNVVEWMKKLEGRVKILHLKDYGIRFGENYGFITELGNGNINFNEVIKVAEGTGVEHLCYEQDNNHKVNSLESAKVSAEYFYSIMK